DKRRNQRTIKLAQHLLQNPAVSLPRAMLSWSNLKSAYRFSYAIVSLQQSSFQNMIHPKHHSK
ncbi:MAG: transposase, partial [Chlamydiales bacterium]|nr:transposase [Chlamydiales bacterium]